MMNEQNIFKYLMILHGQIDTFDVENDSFKYWYDNLSLPNLKHIALIVLKSDWNEAEAERSFSIYTNITNNKKQTSMSKDTKRLNNIFCGIKLLLNQHGLVIRLQ